MDNKEALERIIKSHHLAMAMLCEGRKDDETEKALKIIEKDLNRLGKLEKIIGTLEFLLDIRVSDFHWISLREFLKVLIDDYKDTECIKEWLKNNK